MLKKYKFDKVEAMNHLEAVHGKKLLSFSTAAYYTGQPRLYWQFEGGKDEWANLDPNFGGWAVGRMFFPKSEVVSMKIDVYAETFEFVVREEDSDENKPGRGNKN